MQSIFDIVYAVCNIVYFKMLCCVVSVRKIIFHKNKQLGQNYITNQTWIIPQKQKNNTRQTDFFTTCVPSSNQRHGPPQLLSLWGCSCRRLLLHCCPCLVVSICIMRHSKWHFANEHAKLWVFCKIAKWRRWWLMLHSRWLSRSRASVFRSIAQTARCLCQKTSPEITR